LAGLLKLFAEAYFFFLFSTSRAYHELSNTNLTLGETMRLGSFAVLVMFLSSMAFAADTQKSLAGLKAKLGKLGAPRIEGTDTVAGKAVPALYFGKKKINNNFDIVDDVKKTFGGTATVFVKAGDEYIRISTNVLKDDGSRAIGTPLAKNKAFEAIQKGEVFCGEVTILEAPYDTCYEPIKDGGNTIGIYYVGFKKR